MTVRRAAQAVRGLLPGPRATPFTFILLLLIAAMSLALGSESDDSSILRWTSTNLVNLNHHPVSALLTSAFVSEGGITFGVVVLGVVCAALERRSTAARTALVVTAGHVIASLVTEGAVRIAIAVHADPRAAARQLDVGISYVMYTAVGAAVRFLPARWRRLGVAATVVFVGQAFLRDPGMTTSGHLLAVGIGLLSWPYLVPATAVAKGPERRPAVFRALRVALSAHPRVIALAALATVGVLTACTPGNYLLGRNGSHAQCRTAVSCLPGAVQPGN